MQPTDKKRMAGVFAKRSSDGTKTYSTNIQKLKKMLNSW